MEFKFNINDPFQLTQKPSEKLRLWHKRCRLILPKSTKGWKLEQRNIILASRRGSICEWTVSFKSFTQLIVIIYLCWNIRRGSDSKSFMLTLAPNFFTSGCFLHISQPMCEKKKPLLALCGSALVSVNLWWTRWSRTHSKTLFWNAIVWKISSSTLSFLLALYAPWAHNRWAPAVIPKPVASPMMIAVKTQLILK